MRKQDAMAAVVRTLMRELNAMAAVMRIPIREPHAMAAVMRILIPLLEFSRPSLTTLTVS